jgi:RNA polymerase sigma factor (sigma-70 family)
MFSACLRIINHREDAEDVLQESFIAAFNGLNNFKLESSFGTWLKTIVINKSINFVKKKKIAFTSLSDLMDYEEEVNFETTSLSVAQIKEALKELSDGYRIVFSLYLFENMSHKEIAAHLDISEGTSKSQFNRAKKRLKEKLEELGYGKG